jgi:hypothetical protein
MTTLTSPAGTLTIDTFPTPGEGCLGYLVTDEATRTALAIDPRLDSWIGSSRRSRPAMPA